jgi:hypothetical protein
MDTDFSGGKKTKKTIQPLNDLNTPKLPSFDTVESPDIPPAALPPEALNVQPLALPPTDQIPYADNPELPSVSTENEDDVAPEVQATPTKGFFRTHWTLSKHRTIVFAVISMLLIIGCGAMAFFTRPSGQGGTYVSQKPTYTPKVTTVASTLSGLQVEPDVNSRAITGVMIENSVDARPQSGLDQASVVFEAIAEGGITRFLALFQDTAPGYIGPVRSARPYYVQWCMSFDCALGHAGGSPEALSNIKSWGTKDLDQFANSGAYQRVTNRYAPHNLYSSIDSLNKLESSKGFSTPSFTPLVRKKSAPSKTPNASSIDVAISSATYNSHYDYDAATNSYKRNQDGAAHMTVDGAGNQTQITPKVVVVLVTSYGVASDKHSSYGVTGSGEALVFQDGTVTHGSWNKDDYKSALSLKNDAGTILTLNPGQTWFVALPSTSKVSYH